MMRQTPKFGPTHDFPEGKISKDDEGGLLTGVAWDEKSKCVIVNFGKPIIWIGLPREHAVQFAQMILKALPKEGT